MWEQCLAKFLNQRRNIIMQVTVKRLTSNWTTSGVIKCESELAPHSNVIPAVSTMIADNMVEYT